MLQKEAELIRSQRNPVKWILDVCKLEASILTTRNFIWSERKYRSDERERQVRPGAGALVLIHSYSQAARPARLTRASGVSPPTTTNNNAWHYLLTVNKCGHTSTPPGITLLKLTLLPGFTLFPFVKINSFRPFVNNVISSTWTEVSWFQAVPSSHSIILLKLIPAGVLLIMQHHQKSLLSSFNLTGRQLKFQAVTSSHSIKLLKINPCRSFINNVTSSGGLICW